MKYLVIGIYADNDQRFADSYETETPEEAQELAIREADAYEGTQLIVAAVIEDADNVRVVL